MKQTQSAGNLAFYSNFWHFCLKKPNKKSNLTFLNFYQLLDFS